VKTNDSSIEPGAYSISRLEDLTLAIPVSLPGWYTFCFIKAPGGFPAQDNALAFIDAKQHWDKKGSCARSGLLLSVRQEQLPKPVRECLSHYPLFYNDGNGPFCLNETQQRTVASLFDKIADGITSAYPYKNQLMANLVLQLIHLAIKHFTAAGVQ
jgi:hypothetical protein